APGNGRADLMEAERESGDDPEVAATTPERPEEVGVMLTVGEADPAVGGDDLDLLEVVHRPSEATGQVAEPAAEREAGEPVSDTNPSTVASPCSWVASSTC